MLEKIHSPQDVRRLSVEELPELAAQIRSRILEVVSSNGGHLASSLGSVELIIALHYCLDTPRDKILFDVGHQAYAHKIITGRNGRFHTLRQSGGISGFPTREESEFDVFTAGHSSSAVSLALGLVSAGDVRPENASRAVAVIGDGALSGGLCFEGLNNAGHLKKDLLVVLNTNELSIAPNVGAVSTYLNKLISLPIYNRFKQSFEAFVNSRIPRGSRILKLAGKFEEGLKGLFIPGMLFEELGFRYFGPLDGHNCALLIATLKNLRGVRGPKLLHVITTKGKGYAPAEKDPVRFHSVGAFSIDTGIPRAKPSAASYTDIFRQAMVDLGSMDTAVTAVTAAMPEGTGLDAFRDRFPDRFFDVGIAEGHAVCFAAGLAAGGLKPVVAIYSTFLQRAYDQIIEDVCLQGVPVIFALDRASVGDDGVTHQGIFDLAFLRTIPSMTIMAPASGEELRQMLSLAAAMNSPVAIRYPKAAAAQTTGRRPVEKGKAEVIAEGEDFLLAAAGSMVEPCAAATALLAEQGLHGTLINARFVHPLDAQLFRERSRAMRHIFSAEEGVVSGGFGSALSEELGRPVICMGFPSQFVSHGKREELLARYGLTPEQIVRRIRLEVEKDREGARNAHGKSSH